MKRAFFYVIILFLLCVVGQIAQAQQISKLLIDSRKVYRFNSKDSSGTMTIDTLIMKKRSGIQISNKKTFNLTVKHAFIEEECSISGDDNKNNGTNLTLVANFKELKSLTINTSGLDAKISNQRFPNGNGGDVSISYLSTGVIPQTNSKNKPGYLNIVNRGGGNITTAQDLIPIMGRINTSSSRPLANLPNGQVFSGATGKEGKTTITKVDVLN